MRYVNPRRFIIGQYRKPRAQRFIEHKDYMRFRRYWQAQGVVIQ